MNSFLQYAKEHMEKKVEARRLAPMKMVVPFPESKQKPNDPSAEAKLGSINPDELMRIDNNVYIRPFKFDMILPQSEGHRVGIVGTTGSGKSYMLRNIMYQLHEKIPVWRGISPSEPGNRQYGSYFDTDLFLEYNFSDGDKFYEEIQSALKAVKTRQLKRCDDWWIKGTKEPRQYFRDPSMCLFVDDISTDPTVYNTQEMNWIMQVSRNFHLLFIILLQYVTLFPLKHRLQFSHLIIYPQNSNREIKKLFMEFGGMFAKVDHFAKALSIATQDHGALVLDVSGRSLKIEDRVFYYRPKAPKDLPPFKLGSSWFRKMQRRYYNEDWLKEDDKRRKEEETKKTVEQMQKDLLKNAKISKQMQKDMDLQFYLLQEGQAPPPPPKPS